MSLRAVRRWAVASLVANIAIVVTGGAVRLTASGLGCPTWPRCTADSYVPTPEYGIHGAIEFGNRLLTFVLAAVAVATFVAAWQHRPRRRDLRRLALALGLGIPLQAVIGGITVLTDLDPWVVMLHFVVSMVMIAAAVALVRRAGTGGGPTEPAVPPVVGRLVAGVAGVVAVVVYLGVVTTGSGPHAGDAGARRTGLDPTVVSQLHADAVFLLLGLTVGLVVALAAAHAPGRVRSAARTLLLVELGQGLIGGAQTALALPELLVGLHLLGAALTVAAAADLVLATRRPVADPVPAVAPRAEAQLTG